MDAQDLRKRIRATKTPLFLLPNPSASDCQNAGDSKYIFWSTDEKPRLRSCLDEHVKLDVDIEGHPCQRWSNVEKAVLFTLNLVAAPLVLKIKTQPIMSDIDKLS
ncbi:hypothetical protein NPIL_55791 [Nephila pilipes]|uniref:Uncharacterized protein n=1 Tax=Nephila pilipes TaxID=299642 RepID=A0A8X6NYU3_NEPPI|nr:hypothetical protein NPIL_55791 [Nephila pilipes]